MGKADMVGPDSNLMRTGAMPEILAVLLWIGVAVGIGWILCRVLRERRMVCLLPATLIASGAMALALYFRFGLTVTAVQGLFLWFTLLYGSMSDLTDHTMPDSVWVVVLALAIPSIMKHGIASMLAGAVCVMLPQLALAVIPPHRTLGGADIKLSGALAVLLGFMSGLTAFLAGLLMAVVTVTVRDFVQTRLHKRRDCPKKPFALIPFLVETVEVGSYGLSRDILRDKTAAVGKYATTDLYAGEYLIPAKLTANGADANGILESLTVGKKAISVTLGSFAQGLSGKLETGDIVSVIVYKSKEGVSVTPPELQYLRVITSTTSQGVDKANITDSTQPVTVTLLVNQAQAELLSAYEKSASMHFALEYRGDAETAAQYLAVQEEYFRNGGQS